MTGRYGAQRGSMRMRDAIQAGYWQIRKARMPESTMEIVRPVRKTFRPWLSWAAMYWERAVWMEPPQRAKQMP